MTASAETPRSLAEELRWKKFSVLDDGFVCLVDVMGDDSSIVQAARVSYGEGTKRVSDDRTLIRYLLRHRHTTPFEMAEIKFLVRVPMDCWRQWVRHRTACLAGDTTLYFDLPGAEKRGRRQRHNLTIAKLHRLWNEGSSHVVPKKKSLFVDRVDVAAVYTIHDLSRLVERREETLRNLIRDGKLVAEREQVADPKQPSIYVRGQAWIDYAETGYSVTASLKARLSHMQLRMCDEVTGEIGRTTITDVWESGVKRVFRVTLANGYQIKMSKDHLCLTEAGWKTLEEATGLRCSESGSCSWNAQAPAFAVNGVAVYKDREWLTEKRQAGWSVTAIADEAGMSYHTIRKYLAKFDLKFSEAEKGMLRGETMTGRKRNVCKRGPLSGEALENVQRARCGTNSNFWRGGVTTDRAKIGRWTTDNSLRVHERCGYKCVICGSKKDLEAHHVDPVWNNVERAYDLTNLVSLCYQCHSWLHQGNHELALLNEVVSGEDLATFWGRHTHRESRPAKKRKPAVRKLKRVWSQIVRIEYVGEEMTYDLSVTGPYHNFVANGFIVHNSINEYSTRYSLAIDAAQTTSPEEWRSQSTNNRQGSAGYIGPELGEQLTETERELLAKSRELYQARIEQGVAREQARKDLPLSTYTEAYWKIDLHNLLHFLALRMDSHAQLEIREYATTIGEQIVKPLFPVAWEAFMDYRFHSSSLSRLETEVIQRLMATASQRGVVPPFSQELFLEVQEEAWRPLTRSRERDECVDKLKTLGILQPE